MRQADWTNTTRAARRLCTETQYGLPPLETTMSLAAALDEVAPLVQAVVDAWGRYPVESLQLAPHLELMTALDELAAAVGHPAVDD